MPTFSGECPRELAICLGEEARSIGEKARYETPSGRMVHLKEAIDRAACGTQSYPPDSVPRESVKGPHETQIEVANETTLSACRRLLDAGLNPVALNFASATEPGGGFLCGGRAQEEYLTRSSCLYECLRDNPMYAYNLARHDPLDSSYMIYSPEVPGDPGGRPRAP